MANEIKISILHQVAKYDRNTDLLKKVDMIQIIEFAQGSKFKTFDVPHPEYLSTISY